VLRFLCLTKCGADKCTQKHHYQDLPENLKRHVGVIPDGFLAYFTRRFPRLFLHVHGVIKDSLLAHESMFRSYFDPQE
jgi:serine/threonine-protein kinase/endoribonuclease IRE1